MCPARLRSRVRERQQWWRRPSAPKGNPFRCSLTSIDRPGESGMIAAWPTTEKKMALAKETHIAPDRLVPPAVKDFLESFSFGRWGIRGGRQIVRLLQKLRDPVQRKHWRGRFSLPLRNAVLLNRPITVSFNGIRVSLVPRGAVAAYLWAGLSSEKQEVSFILKVLQPGMIFFDVGTNVGLFAISAAKKIGGKGVYAF